MSTTRRQFLKAAAKALALAPVAAVGVNALAARDLLEPHPGYTVAEFGTPSHREPGFYEIALSPTGRVDIQGLVEAEWANRMAREVDKNMMEWMLS